MSPLIYSSLNFKHRETRLLRLAHSGDFKSRLETTLFKFDLDATNKISYQALSYVWGDPNVTTEIGIDDSSVQVTENLATALRYIRSETEDTVLWVDAICINQQDDLEKGYQVSNMASIYTEAESVIAWIGEESRNIDLALEWIGRYARWQRCAVKNPDESNALFNIEPSYADAITELGRKPYWTRTWIVQELVLAKKIDVLCSRIHIKIDDLVHAHLAWQQFHKHPRGDVFNIERLATWIRLLGNKMSHMLLSVYQFSQAYEGSAASIELSYEFLNNFTHMEASDPRDKIYGLLGIVSRHCTHPVPIAPDYAKSVPQLYCEVARSLISASKNLDCLIYAGNQRCAQRIDSLPSWIPDWRGGNENFPLFRSQTMRLTPPSSEIIPAVSGLFSDDGAALRVKGFILDRITNVQSNMWPIFGGDRAKFVEEILLGQPLGDLTSLEAYFRLMKLNQAMERDTTFQKIDPKENSYWDAVAGFLLFLSGPLGDPQLAENDMEALISVFFNGSLDERGKIALVKLVKGTNIDHERYFSSLHYTASNRNTFRTSRGLMGLGRERILAGDLVFFLFGSSFPIVLRKESGHYTSIGECFILNFTAPNTADGVDGLEVLEIR